MTRKKNRKIDSRGYSNTSKTFVSAYKQNDSSAASTSAVVVAGKSKKRVEISKLGQDELSCLLDDLKKDQWWKKTIGSNKNKEPILFSTKDKKMINKITKLVRCYCNLFD